jgi:hypothetical protein
MATYSKHDVYKIVDKGKGSPWIPVLASIVLSPTAETLIQIEGCSTVSKFNVREPLRNYVEKCGIHSDCSSYNPLTLNAPNTG